jgi:hypothetical protein
MSFRQLSALLLLLSLASAPTVMAAPPSPWDTTKIVTEATSGQFKATKGKYFDKECNASLDYTTEVVDLNADSQPEVFTSVQGTCLGGMAGVSMNLYIKNANGQWKPQFGFPGIYTVLKTKNKGLSRHRNRWARDLFPGVALERTGIRHPQEMPLGKWTEYMQNPLLQDRPHTASVAPREARNFGMQSDLMKSVVVTQWASNGEGSSPT